MNLRNMKTNWAIRKKERRYNEFSTIRDNNTELFETVLSINLITKTSLNLDKCCSDLVVRLFSYL